MYGAYSRMFYGFPLLLDQLPTCPATCASCPPASSS
jgi:hypothetical protein